jgi:hypothetical protein
VPPKNKKGGPGAAFLISFLIFSFNQLPARRSSSITAATTAIATAALTLRASLVDIQRAPADFMTVQRCNGAIAFRVIAHLHEAKAARLAGIAIRNDVHAIDLAIRLEQPANILFSRPEAEVSYKNVFHLMSSFWI